MNAQAAHAAVYQAVKRGDLVKSKSCEICGRDSVVAIIDHSPWGDLRLKTRIVAHHWNGYDHPLDVWWICLSCNRRLQGRHDGALSLEDARLIIRRHRWFSPLRICTEERDLMAQTGHHDINTMLDYRDDAGHGAMKAARAAFGETPE